MSNLKSSLEFWATAHSDAWHPGSRDDCSHCQEMIRCFGEMPQIHEILAANQRYRARDVLARPRIPTTLRVNVLIRDGNKCCECGSPGRLTMDHKIPFSKGGETTLENLRALCRRCNSKKGAKIEAAA